MNHVNYSRWLTKFQLDLFNIDTTHPGLRAIMDGGVFTVRRTSKAFSRCPVDLTLEQTVNADAASRMTGLSSATNNYSARLRWMITKSTRAAVISMAQNMVGLTHREDTTAELHQTRVKRDNRDLVKVTEQIQDTCNPFEISDVRTKKLYNISTGKVASDAVQIFLLGIPSKGNERHKEFVALCSEDGANFEKPIKKEKLLTFKEECKSNKRNPDKRVASPICSRDLMGRLIILANKQQLNLERVFSYPLTPVPLSMRNSDGTMAKTEKSALFRLLEGKASHSPPPNIVDACIVDGNFLLHTLPPHLPGTYGGLAAGILQQATSLSKSRVDIIFDAYPHPSIKESERSRRGLDDEKEYVITGPEQYRPKKIADSLKSTSFKQQLPQFLAKEWESHHYAKLIQQRNVYLAYLGTCFHFFVRDGKVIRENVERLITNHEEADTLICAHLKDIDTCINAENISIRASDTDIAIILLYHIWKFIANIWMDVGTSSKNDRRYVNITAIGNAIGLKLCEALPGFHAFSGCDYMSAFVRKGKVRPFAILEKDEGAQRAFATMATGELDLIDEECLKSFTASMYGAKAKCVSLNQHRYRVFE